MTGPGPDAVQLDGAWFAPHRRHLTPAQLRAELGGYGFEVIEQTGPLGGDVVCRLRD